MREAANFITNFCLFYYKLCPLVSQPRLKALGMYSQERRRERYAVIFIWKISEGLISGYDMSFQQSARRGRLAVVPPFAANSSAPVRNAREASLRVKGARLFNLLPKEIGDMQSVTVIPLRQHLTQQKVEYSIEIFSKRPHF